MNSRLQRFFDISSYEFHVIQGQTWLKVFLEKGYEKDYLLLIEQEVWIQGAFEQFQLDIFDQAAFVTNHSVPLLILLLFSAKYNQCDIDD